MTDKKQTPGTIAEILWNWWRIRREPIDPKQRAPLIIPPRGLGDSLHNVAERLDIGQRVRSWFGKQRRSCGCPQRQHKCNVRFPYTPKPFVIDPKGQRHPKPFLTLGMATAGDWSGTWSTINSILGECSAAGLLDFIEIVIVDNKPEDWQGVGVKNYVETWLSKWVRYVPFTHIRGTSAPRQHVFDQARGEWVGCFDCHLSFRPGSIVNTIRYLMRHRFDKVLFGGVLDNSLATTAGCLTHLDLTWRGNMLGTWQSDARGVHPQHLMKAEKWDASKNYPVNAVVKWKGSIWQNKEDMTTFEPLLKGRSWRHVRKLNDKKMRPFDVDNIACWAMLCRKDAWPRFHPLARDFGGEEGTLALTAKARGMKVQCLPMLRAAHRFNPVGQPRGYGTPMASIVRNHALILHAIGDKIRLQELRDYFAGPRRADDSTRGWLASISDGETEQSESFIVRNAAIVDSIIAGAIVEHENMVKGMQLESLYQRAAATPSDINEHVPRLRDLAKECDVVVEFGTRHAVSTVALMAGRPRILVTVDLHGCATCTENSLIGAANAVGIEFQSITANTLELPPIERADMLFIDTYHTAAQVRGELDRHAGQVSKIIAFHDTEAPWGQTGEDGGPGVMIGVEQWLGNHPEWIIAERHANNHGLVVLRRKDADAAISKLVAEVLR